MSRSRDLARKAAAILGGFGGISSILSEVATTANEATSGFQDAAPAVELGNLAAEYHPVGEAGRNQQGWTLFGVGIISTIGALLTWQMARRRSARPFWAAHRLESSLEVGHVVSVGLRGFGRFFHGSLMTDLLALPGSCRAGRGLRRLGAAPALTGRPQITTEHLGPATSARPNACAPAASSKWSILQAPDRPKPTLLSVMHSFSSTSWF